MGFTENVGCEKNTANQGSQGTSTPLDCVYLGLLSWFINTVSTQHSGGCNNVPLWYMVSIRTHMIQYQQSKTNTK